jgi:hypothetical protein
MGPVAMLALFSLFIPRNTREMQMDGEEKSPVLHLWRLDSGAPKLLIWIVTPVSRQGFGAGCMSALLMRSVVHWFAANANVLAILVTVGVAVLLICCLECTNCPCRDKDDIFRHHEL